MFLSKTSWVSSRMHFTVGTELILSGAHVPPPPHGSNRGSGVTTVPSTRVYMREKDKGQQEVDWPEWLNVLVCTESGLAHVSELSFGIYVRVRNERGHHRCN
jgi:hypothetical protein